MLGRRNKPVRKLLLALDMTQETVAQAVAKKADMLITHHPAIFHKLGNVTDADWQQELLLQLAENGVAVYSAHTNLDCVANGLLSTLRFPYTFRSRVRARCVPYSPTAVCR